MWPLSPWILGCLGGMRLFYTLQKTWTRDWLDSFSGSVNPYCQIECENYFYRTNTEIKTKCPEWNKCFNFDIKDPFSILHISVIRCQLSCKYALMTPKVNYVFLLLRKASNCWLWLCYKNYCVCMMIVLSEKLNSSPLILGCADIRLSSLHSSASSHQAVWVKLKNSKLRSVNDKNKSLNIRLLQRWDIASDYCIRLSGTGASSNSTVWATDFKEREQAASSAEYVIII